jgi:hypothetical protein
LIKPFRVGAALFCAVYVGLSTRTQFNRSCGQ